MLKTHGLFVVSTHALALAWEQLQQLQYLLTQTAGGEHNARPQERCPFGAEGIGSMVLHNSDILWCVASLAIQQQQQTCNKSSDNVFEIHFDKNLLLAHHHGAVVFKLGS